VYTALSIGIFFAGLGLPGLCGFIGEVLVVLSVWNYSYVLAIIAASVMILTAGYILWAVQRVYLGPEYKGPHAEAITPSNRRENAIAGVLFVLAILFGVFPQTFLLRYMDKTIDRQVRELADWTKQVKEVEPAHGATLETRSGLVTALPTTEADSL
jgi:NADH-quinone oxidoreductase subunit M